MDATGKVILITGATAGLGEAAALGFARQGARVVVTARDRGRGEHLLCRLQECGPGQEHSVVYGDLSRLADMRRVGRELADSLERLDVLANNAAGWFDRRHETEDGLELTFALNHMAYFVLTGALLDVINATPGARVVNTASRAHTGAALDFDDLQTRRDYSMLTAYRRSKLCNILFTRALGRRLAPGRTTTCFHPGAVLTGMWYANDEARLRAPQVAANPETLTPVQAAESLAWHALSPEAGNHNGAYFDGRDLAEVGPEASDDEAAERLWHVSQELALQ